MTSIRLAVIVLALVLGVVGCRGAGEASAQAPASMPSGGDAPGPARGQPRAEPPAAGMAVATFAGGCFWCMEGPFEALDGVVEVLSGYTGGSEEFPTYDAVGHGRTGHTEAVRVVYDPARVTYEALLERFWRSMDPTDAGGQFADRGRQYRPGIFYHTVEQRAAAEASRDALAASGRFEAPIIVPVEPAGDFWVAEDYHQDYYRTNAARYQRYRQGSGRSAFLERVWGEDVGAH